MRPQRWVPALVALSACVLAPVADAQPTVGLTPGMAAVAAPPPPPAASPTAPVAPANPGLNGAVLPATVGTGLPDPSQSGVLQGLNSL